MSQPNELPQQFKANGFTYTKHTLRKQTWKNRDGKSGTSWCYTSNPKRTVMSSFDLGVDSSSLELRDRTNVQASTSSTYPMWLPETFTDAHAEKLTIEGNDTIYVRVSNDPNMPVANLTVDIALAERASEEIQFNAHQTPQQPTQTTQSETVSA
tara:strand:- start:2257 stop:2718 length:462 start_codon:yes stop_codon:yes gene_type:complete